MNNQPIKWAAKLAHVREVSLLCTADLAFWKNRLIREDLAPIEQDGKARLLIIAADAKFMGIRFREMSFSVLVAAPQTGSTSDAALLVQAFNSSRSFTFCERVFFSTPYSHGNVRVTSSSCASIHVRRKGEAIFAVQMNANTLASPREHSYSGENGWDGPIFLPRSLRRKDDPGNVFFARINGLTHKFPFSQDRDLLTINPPKNGGVLQDLIDSRFEVDEWIIREDADHAKSKTYRGVDRFTSH